MKAEERREAIAAALRTDRPISATTLVNGDESSYVARLKRIPKDRIPDLVVVQLSTNDATTGIPILGATNADTGDDEHTEH